MPDKSESDSKSDSESSISNDLAKKIQTAEPETLSTARPTSEDEEEEDFMDIVMGLVEGDIEPSELEDKLVTWANARVDVPYVPEALERQLVGLTLDLLVTAVTEIAASMA